MSFALSSFLIWPPVQSRASTMKSSPGFTVTTGGMSGCQRLCCGWACSFAAFLMSTDITVLAMTASPLSNLKMLAHDGVRQIADPALRRDAAGFEDGEALGDVADEIQVLLDQQHRAAAIGRDAFDDLLDLRHHG